MPKIPTIGPWDVKQASLPGNMAMRSASVPAGAFSPMAGAEEAGKSITKLGGAFGDISADRAEREDKIAYRDALVNFSSELNGLSIEYDKRKLRDATGVYDEGFKQSDELLKKFSDSLANDRQRELFIPLAASRREAHLARWANHQQEETKAADKQTSLAMVNDAKNSAWNDYTNKSAIIDAKNSIKIGMQSLMAGADPEAVKLATDTEISKMHLGIIERAKAQSNGLAMSYYSWAQGEMLGSDKIHVEQSLKSAIKAESADNTAKLLYQQLDSGERTDIEIRKEIMGIEDVDTRRTVLGAYGAYSSLWKQEQAQLVQDGTIDVLAKMNAMNLPDAYKMVQTLPDTNNVQREIKKVAEKYYSHSAQAGGFNPFTDPAVFDSGLNAINTGQVTDEKGLRVFLAAQGPVAEKDIKRLGEEMKNRQKPITSLKSAFMFAIGKNDNLPDTKLSPREKDQQLKFIDWAEGMIRSTNRGNDPEYIRSLAKTFVLQGEIVSDKESVMGKLTGDYGPNRAFYSALGNKDWLPELTADDEDRIRTIFKARPDVAKKWKDDYGDLAMRAYRRLEIKTSIAPRPGGK